MAFLKKIFNKLFKCKHKGAKELTFEEALGKDGSVFYLQTIEDGKSVFISSNELRKRYGRPLK